MSTPGIINLKHPIYLPQGADFEFTVKRLPSDFPVPTPTPQPTPTPTPTPAPAFNFSQLHFTDQSLDVRGWAETTKITRVELANAGMKLTFDAKGRWPSFIPAGFDGPIQYTVGLAAKIGGVWYASLAVDCDHDYIPLGDLFAPDQLKKNVWYYAGQPLAGYQPASGEKIGIFVAAGALRRQQEFQVAERSNMVQVPFVPGVTNF